MNNPTGFVDPSGYCRAGYGVVDNMGWTLAMGQVEQMHQESIVATMVAHPIEGEVYYTFTNPDGSPAFVLPGEEFVEAELKGFYGDASEAVQEVVVTGQKIDFAAIQNLALKNSGFLVRTTERMKVDTPSGLSLLVRPLIPWKLTLDLMAHDQNGNPIFKNKKLVIGDGPDGEPAPRFLKGELEMADGTTLTALQYIGNDPKWQYDCHGFSLTEGKFWVNNEAVGAWLGKQTLLSKTVTPQTGDLVILRKLFGGDVVHSGIYVYPDSMVQAAGYSMPNGNKTFVTSVNDAWTHNIVYATYYSRN